MKSIGDGIRNFFRSTVQINDNSTENPTSLSIDKSIIRQALWQGSGFWGMLKGMKAIRQANCDINQLVQQGNLKETLGKAGQVIELIHENISKPSPGEVSMGIVIVLDRDDALKKLKDMLKNKNFAQCRTLNKNGN